MPALTQPTEEAAEKNAYGHGHDNDEKKRRLDSKLSGSPFREGIEENIDHLPVADQKGDRNDRYRDKDEPFQRALHPATLSANDIADSR